MNSREDWLERQQRMVKCPRHGLHFDPKMSTGCVRCLKERAKIRQRRPPQLFIILLCVLGIAVVLFRIFGPSLLPQDEALDGLEVSAASPDRPLDAEAYRPSIEAFETALFRSESTTSSDLQNTQGRISSTLELLDDTVQERDGDTVASAEISALAEDAQDRRLSFARLESLRDRWLQVRDRHLTTAAWFYTPPASRRSVAAEQRASVAEYRDIAYELAALLREGSAEVAGLAGQEDRNARWQDFTQYLNDTLRDITERKPSRPRADADARLLVAFQKLERAFGMARSLGAAKAPPSDTGRFEEALRMAEEAVQGFDDVR